MRVRTFVVGLGTLLFIPPIALAERSEFAYVTPEQVLIQNQNQYFVPEEEEDAPNMQKQRSKGEPLRTTYKPYSEMTEEERKGVLKESPASVETSAGRKEENEEEEVADSEDSEEEGVSLSPSTIRLLGRIERLRHRTSAAPEQAPLAPTGPETLLAMGALLAGMYFTMRRARKLEQR
jgi:hypothetical protein